MASTNPKDSFLGNLTHLRAALKKLETRLIKQKPKVFVAKNKLN